MEKVSQWVRFGPEPTLAQEGPPLMPLGEVPKEAEDGAMLSKRMVPQQKRTIVPQQRRRIVPWWSRPLNWPKQAQLWQISSLDCCCCRGGVLFGGHVGVVGGLCTAVQN